MSLDSEINTIPILDVKGLHVEINKFAISSLSYELNLKLSRIESPTKFIEEFLEENRYVIMEYKYGQKFEHNANYSEIAAKFADNEKTIIRIKLNMTGPSKINYQSPDFLQLPTVNALLLKMIKMYAK